MMPRLHHLRQVGMATPYTLIVAGNARPPKGTAAPSSIPDGAPYEPEHSERQVAGSVAVGQESRWRATLAVPMTGDQSALLTLEREGSAPAGAPAVEQVMLVILPGEADAVLTLLRGIVAHARRSGVLVGPDYP
jgi:hypothetical protein